MKLKESSSIALQISLILGFIVSAILIYIYLITSTNLFLLLGILFIFVLVTFWIIQNYIERYIYDHIKVIYKLIHDHKVKSNHKGKPNQTKIANIKSVHQEVLEWSDDYEKEISQLKQLEQYRKEYIGNISHELKTPLFTILGYISTLIDGGLEDDNINTKYLERSEKNINRLIGIVKELETISQLESGELKLNISRFNIKALCDELLESFEMKVDKKNILMYYGKNYDRPIYVNADKEKVARLISNLLGNAIKYGYANTGKVKISFFDMDENLLVEITDNGPGINKEDLPRIYERFYRTDKARSRELGGTGLGLAIVKHIVEAHKQSIYTRSTIGIGTTFGFTLEKA
ncbi:MULTISPECIES: cell wall metabolism sensor histidine kinase WalK [unclassified Lentimicrobium]|uniref:sensor histidine kinase n=1 Tax=unclassified Lentimicrobium TaxID=2677434 RepID=UPI0015582A81|nr:MULTISPECIES: ATP-binding protein [unclassified Lentimicrobium]NPD46173.1 sensor histidine kinase [Lentimicrobium sp. S6]NPD83224.1 sensor histidine kinase [Lentimicrobium sp. L6]